MIPDNFMFGGIDIVESYLAVEQVIRLSDDVMVSDEFRAKCNAYYLSVYGMKPCAYMINNDTLVAHPEIVKVLRETKLNT